MGVSTCDEEIDDERHVELFNIRLAKVIGAHASDDVLCGRTAL